MQVSHESLLTQRAVDYSLLFVDLLKHESEHIEE